eukprot:238954-Prymnesium_polylepis.1
MGRATLPTKVGAAVVACGVPRTKETRAAAPSAHLGMHPPLMAHPPLHPLKRRRRRRRHINVQHMRSHEHTREVTYVQRNEVTLQHTEATPLGPLSRTLRNSSTLRMAGGSCRVAL